ncbi:Ctf8-domain-containing protein [Rhodocollybia butyracea]|uniref:Ctf8-domain-containing protein n=1 Tax=Rhodocollybia butyracea TaxID=206335 RepID=A0A9P5PUV5_9AGAR|nr:Ctf8-domain-containing protein [Rhodocollybia butyracea]
MLIPITFDAPSSFPSKLPPSLAKISHDEVVLLELQGALEFTSDSNNPDPTERDGKLVGTLSIDDDLKRPTLRIGHHLIEGKIANLPKPLAVLHRTQTRRETRISGFSDPETQWTSRNESQNESQNEDVMMDDSQGEPPVQWNAIAIVKRKIIFSKRPMPLSELTTGQADEDIAISSRLQFVAIRRIQ